MSTIERAQIFTRFLNLIRDLYISIFDCLDSYSFLIAGSSVSILDILAGCLILGFAFSLLYRGVKA